MTARVGADHARGVWRVAAALVLFALVVRIAAAVVSFGAPLAFDATDYDRHARSIASGHGYPEAVHPRGGSSALRPPAFPLVLAGAYALHGGVKAPGDWQAYFSPRYTPDPAHVEAGRILQALIGTVITALVGLIALQLWGERVGLVALAITAGYPPLILLGLTLLSDPLFVMFELGAVAAMLRARAPGAPAVGWPVVAGALAGLAWLTRSNGYVLLVPLALLVWTVRPRLTRGALVSPAALVLTAVLVITPWTIRNAIVMGAFIPVSDNGGYTLAGTYNPSAQYDPQFRGGWRPPQTDREYSRLAMATRGELDETRVLGGAALRYIATHPLYVLEVGYCNTLRLAFLGWLACGDSLHSVTLGYTGEEGTRPLTAYIAILSFALIAVAAIAGAFASLVRRTPPALWLIPFLLWTSVFVLAANRFRAPLEPFLIMLAAVAVVNGWDRGRRRIQ